MAISKRNQEIQCGVKKKKKKKNTSKVGKKVFLIREKNKLTKLCR